MNKQELIDYCNDLKESKSRFINCIDVDGIINTIKQLDEPETGHADEAPRYVKNILARLRELPLHDREVWLKAIMGEFEKDFSRAKWHEGYEQGKFEGAMIPYDEPEKAKVPQLVADWITHSKNIGRSLFGAMSIFEENFEIKEWMQWAENQEIFARAWLDGYEAEEERYTVVMKTTKQPLYYNAMDKKLFFSTGGLATQFTRKQLEEAGFGWVFDCEGIEIEEVE